MAYDGTEYIEVWIFLSELRKYVCGVFLRLNSIANESTAVVAGVILLDMLVKFWELVK